MNNNQDSEERGGGGGTPDASQFFTTIIGKVTSGIFSDDKNDTWRDHIKRLGIGGAGGFFYVCIKNYFGAGIGVYQVWMMDPTSPSKGELMFGYVCAYLVGTVVGGITAWLSAQKSGRLLFLIGMFGVQILLTILPSIQSKGAGTVGWIIEELRPVVPAYAQGEEKCVGDSAFMKGLKAGFGVRDQYDKFAVVVASGKNLDEVQAKLKAINGQDSSLKLRVGPRACDNNFYPIFASDYLPLSDAKAALEKIRKSSGISDAYLSPGPPYQN